MGKAFDDWWEQVKEQFVGEVPPLKLCGNCGKEIVSTWAYKNEILLLHKDKTMCCKLVTNV